MRKWAVVLSLALLLLFTIHAFAETEQKTFNDYVLEVMKSYPTDGSMKYAWVDEPGYYGITKDLYYLDQLFVNGDSQQRSYCSGITFEVFLQAYEAYNRDHDLTQIGDIDTLEKMDDFRLRWYGADGDRRTIKYALESSGLGYQITDLNQVQPGDFVQIWRHSGSGHTVIFQNWLKTVDGEIFGFNYWSSNSQKGPSYREEYFGEYGTYINLNETYFMRVIDPLEWWAQNKK